MRLCPSSAEHFTLPLLTDETAVEINGQHATDVMTHGGPRDGLRAPPGCPTFTFHPLSPREANRAKLQANANVPSGQQAVLTVQAVAMARAQWVESGSQGPEPKLDPEDQANFQSWDQEMAYATVKYGLVSIAGVPGCEGPPSTYTDRLPWPTVLEIAHAIRAASEVTPMGKAPSVSAPKAATPITSSSGTANPASETGSARPAATVADPSSAPCSTDTPTPSPTCLGAPSMTAPSSDLTTAFT